MKTSMYVYRSFLALILQSIQILVDAQGGGGDAMMGDLIGGLLNAMGGADDSICKFECPNGETPVPNKGHVPTSNGCGSFGIQFDTSAIPKMVECCDKHDHCYDTCNKLRSDCDKKFQKCLLNKCEKLKSKEQKACKSTAQLMSSGSAALGCESYLQSQKNACLCKRNSEL
ncbi:unnamed protein product [Owenia fusiformis]|uniref:Uncharacterized protein n=1 Tax=Owenia fusiformis TaxID=6347 RepID=A0A8S4PR90_OWEFU|nr:unnamed protein product [Owenia fusiformis]